MGFRINRGIFQYKDGENFRNTFKIAEDGTMVEVDSDGNPTTAFMKVGDKATDADKLDGINSTGFVNTTNNSTLNTDTRNTRGATRLFRNDSNSNYSVQHYWTGAHWFLRGYSGDTFHAEVRVGQADSAGNADTVDGYHANNSGGGIPVLNSNGYWDAPSWINVRGTGLYSSTTNGAHFFPNDQSYGSWRITGTRNGWYGIHFGGSTGVTLMMNESESGVHREGSGWKYRHQGGKFYVHTGTNGGGTAYPVIHEGTIGSQSVDNATKIDGSHKYEVGNRDYTRTGFYVDGEPDIYYPVLITPRGGYAFNRWSISRRYNWTAPWDPIGTGSHKGGLTFDFYWAADTAWGGNDKSIRIHQFSEQYTTMVGGIQLARTGGMIVWLRGGYAYYELQVDTAQATVDVKLEGWTDGSGTRFDPTGDVNQHRSSIWNNYPVRNGDDLYINNNAVATESYVTSRGYITDGNTNWNNTYGFIARGDTQEPGSWSSATKFKSSGQIADADSGSHSLQLIADNNNDAFMSLHVSGDYAVFFGLDGATNRLHTGGWSAGATSYQIWDARDFGQGNINNWNTAYNWGNHSGLYDTVGSAGEVDNRIETEIKPLIDTAQSTADGAVTTANSALTTAQTAETRANGAREDAAAAGTAAANAQSTADGKLGATEKAANSELLDGYDNTAFWKDNEDRRAKAIRFTGEGGDSGNGVINYGIYQEGGAWSHPYPDLVIGYHTGVKIGGQKGYGGVRIYSDAPGRSAANKVASFAEGDENVRIVNNLHIGSAGGWITDLLNAKATTGDVAGIDARINDEVLPQVDTNATNISRNATDIATKAAVGGSYGQDFKADDMRVDQWFRNTVSGKGLYNEATTQHFYSDDDDWWNVAGGTGANGIKFRDEHNGAVRGSVYATQANEIGFLDSDNQWAVRVVRDSHVEFRDNNEVTFTVGQGGHGSNYGTVCTHGDGRGGWEGYSINGRFVWMSSDSSMSGMYNDTDNEWMTQYHRNGAVKLYNNGGLRFETQSGGAKVHGTMTATSFAGDGAGLTGVSAPIPFTTVTGEDTACVSINFDGRAMVFTMADGTSYSIDGARPL